jgi:uncharacterized protein
MRAVLRGEQEADVPCDGCVGCCISSYPIPLRPSDAVALARVPDQFLQWPARVGELARMNFRDDGTCPMLEGERCTIYADRPRTCRDYDCRIYAATGLAPDGNRPVIQQRVREWRFDMADAEEQAQAAALSEAAQFIRANAARFPASARAHSATAVAVLAVKTWPLFLPGCAPAASATADLVQRLLEEAQRFDSRDLQGGVASA